MDVDYVALARGGRPHRSLDLRWRSYCLELRDGGELPPSVPVEVRAVAGPLRAASHRALRLFEALRADGREDAIDPLYTEWGRRSFPPGRPPVAPTPGLIADCLAACGLDPALEAAGHDAVWDAPILDSMVDAYAVAGPRTQTPVVVLAGAERRGLKGPVMSPAPTGQRALQLWDAFRVLVDEPGFFEVTRPRRLPG